MWLLAAVAGLLVAGVGTLVALMSLGRLTLDLRWGRSTHPLGPLSVRVSAPREVVFEQIATPYLGRAPREAREHLEVVERGTDLVLALHRTPVHWYTAETLETVRFERPDRVSFRHVRGPVPHAEEEFVLEDASGGAGGGATELRYRGEIGLDLWLVGGLAARLWVRPVWEQRVRESMDEIQRGAEARSAARARRRDDPPGG